MLIQYRRRRYARHCWDWPHALYPAPSKDATVGEMVYSSGSLINSMFESINTMHIKIYHNPNCGTSRNTLALIRNAGIEPEVIEYIKNPPARDVLQAMISNAGLTIREAIRQKEMLYIELKLDNPELSDDALLDAMIAHPILINRPFVVTPDGVRLCRPSEVVLDILHLPQAGPFAKEDGELVIDAEGKRI